MLRLSQGRRKNTEAGEPLYCPFGVLNATETHIRKGQLALVAGGPGTGKSALMHAWLQRGNDNGKHNTVMYFSADSDPFTMWKRSASIATGYTLSDVERMVKEGNTAGLDAIVDEATAHMWMDYRSSPTEEDVLDEVMAYQTVYGSDPEVIVLDNLKNLYQDMGEFEALEQSCMFLHDLARDTNAAIIALHHVVGAAEDGISAIPLSGLRGKVSKTPEVVLTLHRSDSQLNVSPVKNRNGRAQASGAWILPLQADMSRMAYSG